MRIGAFASVTVCCCILFIITACDRDVQQTKYKIYSNSFKSPEEVVKAFCKLDAAGKRLSGPMTEEELSYVLWTEEPGWDAVVVISGCKITNARSTGKVSEVTVEYQVLGKCCNDYSKLNKDEKIIYKVIKTENGWKIKSPDFVIPHVLPQQLVAHFENGLKKEKDAEKIKQYQEWIQKIHELAKKP